MEPKTYKLLKNYFHFWPKIWICLKNSPHWLTCRLLSQTLGRHQRRSSVSILRPGVIDCDRLSFNGRDRPPAAYLEHSRHRYSVSLMWTQEDCMRQVWHEWCVKTWYKIMVWGEYGATYAARWYNPYWPHTILSCHAFTSFFHTIPYWPPSIPNHTSLLPSSPTTLLVGSTHSVLSGSSVKVRRRKLKCAVAQWNHLEQQCRK